MLLLGLGTDATVKKTLGTTHAPRSQDRMRAVAELLDRGFGRTVQEVVLDQGEELTVLEQEPVKDLREVDSLRRVGMRLNSSRAT